jgi:Opioid growth factor receptor (OGFr) conserved region
MSRLLNFYDGTGTDAEGRRLEEIWSWDDGELEAVHDFIQWLFPLPEPSRFNPDAPLLTEEDSTAFRGDERLRANLRRSFERILAFLGLALSADGKVVEGPNFAGRAPDVWAYPNHNWLRITRILRSLRLLGLEDAARALYERLAEFHRGQRFPIAADTFQYWSEAVGV